MLERVAKLLRSLSKDSSGTTLVELSVSLLLLSLVGIGTVGSIAVGTRAGSKIEEQDVSLIIARSQAEFVASQPVAPSYDIC